MILAPWGRDGDKTPVLLLEDERAGTCLPGTVLEHQQGVSVSLFPTSPWTLLFRLFHVGLRLIRRLWFLRHHFARLWQHLLVAIALQLVLSGAAPGGEVGERLLGIVLRHGETDSFFSLSEAPSPSSLLANIQPAYDNDLTFARGRQAWTASVTGYG